VDFTVGAEAQGNAGNIWQKWLRHDVHHSIVYPSWSMLVDVGSVLQKGGKGMFCLYVACVCPGLQGFALLNGPCLSADSIDYAPNCRVLWPMKGSVI